MDEMTDRQGNVWVKQTSLLLTLTLLFAFQIQAQTNAGLPGAFLRMGVGSRALGLGGAFSGLANDASAVYWNPAGTQNLREAEILFMNAALPFDQSQFFFSGVLPRGDLWTFGFAWIGLQIDNIEARSTNTEAPDYSFGSSQNALLFSVARQLSSRLDVGGSFKLIHSSLDQLSATGFGFDMSLLFRPMKRFGFGLVLQDIGTDYRWQESLTEGVPLTLRAGVVWEARHNVNVLVDYHKTTGLSPGITLGVEAYPLNSLPIRFGIGQGEVAGGLGVALPITLHSLELNYSFGTDRIFREGVHRVSVRLAFNRHSPRPDRPTPHPVPLSDFAVTRQAEPSEMIPVVPLDESVVEERWLQVGVELLNVRAGPGVEHKRIAQIRRAERVRSLDRQGVWRQIELHDGRSGWVHQNYVETADSEGTH